MLWSVGLIAFGKVFVHATQTRNVAGHHVTAAFFTSWLSTAGEVALFSAIAARGWETFPAIAAGSSLGVVAAMLSHQYLFPKKPKIST